MPQKKEDYEQLEQYDYLDEDYLIKVENRYIPLIGSFLVNFSLLEHEINIAVAETFGEDYHETGYVVIEKLTFRNKIELLYKMYVRYESFTDKATVGVLKEIEDELEQINTFRNGIVHANWQSLTKEGLVRTKIVVDSDEGYVKFKKIQITPKIIREKINHIKKLIIKLDKYKKLVTERLYDLSV